MALSARNCWRKVIYMSILSLFLVVVGPSFHTKQCEPYEGLGNIPCFVIGLQASVVGTFNGDVLLLTLSRLASAWPVLMSPSKRGSTRGSSCLFH